MSLRFCWSVQYLRRNHRPSHQQLIDFTCATAKDELEKHPEMRTIAMAELENNFPSEFSAKILKCLPNDVAKIIINPHTEAFENNTLKLTKQTLVIYVADVVDWEQALLFLQYFACTNESISFHKGRPVVNHLSKYLIISSDKSRVNETEIFFKNLLNVAQIYVQKRKVISRIFDRIKNLTISKTFEKLTRENFSQILFPDKTKDLYGQELYAVWSPDNDYAHHYDGSKIPNSKWIPYLDLIAEKLNATVKFIEVHPNEESGWLEYFHSKRRLMLKHIKNEKLDFYLNPDFGSKFELETYNKVELCFIAPMPKPYDLTDLILFLPMDKSCWMWLMITIAVSTVIWRISEGHWNFAFGAFSYFMGQAQLSVRVRTNRLTMKILLQLLIFAIFIFSNGYQSLVTSFMLNPLQDRPARTIDEVFDSNLKIEDNNLFEGSPKYQKVEEQGRVVKVENLVITNWQQQMIEMNLVKIKPCAYTRMKVQLDGDGKSADGIYVVDEIVYRISNDLYVRPFHPCLEKIQELMDRSLEVGLHQAWEQFYWSIWRQRKNELSVRKEKTETVKDTLDFGLILPSLYILAIGFPAALVALFCEIFWKDFVSELTKDYFKRKWKEMFGVRSKGKKKKPKVRVIQVSSCPDRESSLEFRAVL